MRSGVTAHGASPPEYICQVSVLGVSVVLMVGLLSGKNKSIMFSSLPILREETGVQETILILSFPILESHPCPLGVESQGKQGARGCIHAGAFGSG